MTTEPIDVRLAKKYWGDEELAEHNSIRAAVREAVNECAFVADQSYFKAGVCMGDIGQIIRSLLSPEPSKKAE